MKRIALIPHDESGLGDHIFSQVDSTFYYFQMYLRKKGIEIHTVDHFISSDKIDAYVVMDLGKMYIKYKSTLSLIKRQSISKLILMISEPPIIHPMNWNKSLHQLFDAVLTWNDDLVDNRKYFKYFWVQDGFSDFNRNVNLDFIMNKKNKLLTTISSNKYSLHRNELYSERRNAIDFFEDKIPEEFDLYGRGWSRRAILSSLDLKYSLKELEIRKIPGLIRSFKKPKSYKGEIQDKDLILSKYWFNLCYENLGNIKGYITEKIWDSFRSMTVPIYLGASNIEKYIPKNCYIDKRQFSSYEELYVFIRNINGKKYLNYLKSISSFVKSKEGNKWYGTGWSKCTGKKILEMLNIQN